MEAARRRPPPPAQLAAPYPPGHLPLLSQAFRAASFAPPAAERQRQHTGTAGVCVHGKFLPAQWRKTQDSPFPSTSTQSAGNLGGARDGGWRTLEDTMHRRTQCGHRCTPTTSCPIRGSRAGRGRDARSPSTPNPPTAPAS